MFTSMAKNMIIAISLLDDCWAMETIASLLGTTLDAEGVLEDGGEVARGFTTRWRQPPG